MPQIWHSYNHSLSQNGKCHLQALCRGCSQEGDSQCHRLLGVCVYGGSGQVTNLLAWEDSIQKERDLWEAEIGTIPTSWEE